MATGDLSRAATYPAKRYAGVGWQQGRTFTDDDGNEAARIQAEDERRSRVEVVGPAGSPDGGFRITDPAVVDGHIDFEIGAGTMYVGGIRAELHAAEPFRRQSDYLRNPGVAAPAGERVDLVYLEVWQQPVSAVEDEELFEAALGGPDTTTRVRTMARVHVRPDVGVDECGDAWAALVAEWQAGGLGTLDGEHRLVPAVTLSVGFQAGGDPDDLCNPPVAGGYLGAENQAIRVRLVDEEHFVWGFDNGGPLYRVRLDADRVTVLMDTEPRDQAHWPLAGQIVELIPWSAVLPNGEKLAEEVEPGHFSRIAGSYDPDGPNGPQIVLATAVPAGFGEEWSEWGDDPNDLLETRFGREGPQQPYFFLRVWDRGADLSSDPVIPIAPAPVPLGTTGLNVTFGGDGRRAGDYWIIAARPETPDRVVPWELEASRPPDGFHRYYAPLALLSWREEDGALVAGVHDCRETFRPLTRIRTCCSVTVGDGHHSHGDFSSIRDAIEALPPSGGEVCILAGEYEESIEIVGRHGITLKGCGRRTRLVSPGAADGGAAAPVLTIRDSFDVRVASLAVEAAADGAGILVAETGWGALDEDPPAGEPVRDIELEGLWLRAAARSAIEVRGGRRIRLRDCRIEMQDTAGPWPAVTVAAEQAWIEDNEITVQGNSPSALAGAAQAGAGLGGIWIRGESEQVVVARNRIRGGIGHGITLGDVVELDDGEAVAAVEGWVYYDEADPCNPCAPGTVIVVTDGGGAGDGGPALGPGYPLREIRIADNTILDMGLSGISVIGFFEDEAEGQILVEGLTIERNEIRNCLRRNLAPTPEALEDRVAYGGVVLADVEDLVLRDNVIQDNGADHLDPVCGVFALAAEGAEISRNRIVNNGAKTDDTPDAARPGARGGIVLRAAIAPVLLPDGKQRIVRNVRGIPAAEVHDNVVVAPLGRALAVMAVGPVSVQHNQLTTQGVDRRGGGLLAATVAILNLGIALEVLAAGADISGFSGALAGGGSDLGGGAGFSTLSGATLAGPSASLVPNGNTLFHGNQCLLDTLDAGTEIALSSVFIASLDDVGFEDNQSDCALLDDVVLANGLLFGLGTVRVLGNRFKETPARAWFSGWSVAYANDTSHNQGTHCFLPLSLPGGRVVAQGNVSMVDLFLPAAGVCSRLGENIG